MIWPIRQGLISGRAALDASAVVPAGAYVYRGTNNTSSTTQSFTRDLGPAATVLVIALLDGQNVNTISSMTVNGTSLTQRVFANTSDTVAIFDGTVAVTGAGTDAIVVNWTVGSSFDRNCFLYTVTGLATGFIGGSAVYPGPPFGPTLSVNAGDLLFGLERGSTTAPWTASTESPVLTHPGVTISDVADWVVASTNASFTAIPQFGGIQLAAAANYR